MENEAITQVMEAEVCPNAEELVPLTEEQADALGVVEAGERIQAIGEHCIQMVGKASDFVLRYLGEIKSMRKRYAQQGRRNPIPGFPTWGKVKDKYFWFISDTHLRRLLAEPKKVKELSASTEEPTPERPQAVAEEIVGVEMKDAPQTGAAPPDAEAQEPETQPEAATPEAHETHDTGKPGHNARPSWISVAADFRKVFSSRYQRDKRIKMFFQEVGEEFYEDIRKAANSLVTPEKDTSASQSEEAKKGNETRRAKAGGNREDRKQEILAIMSAEPAHAFTLHGVSQRMSYNTLSDPMLRKLLNEGVREGKWERFRYRVENRYGWCMPNAYRKWHDSQFAEGRTYDPGNRLFLGSDHEQAAWKEEDEKSAKDSAEWLKRFRAEHPEERQNGETDEEYEKRHAAWEKQQRSERAKQAAATRKLNAEKKKEILEKVKGAILGGATTAEAVCAATGMDSDEVDEVLEKLQEQGEEGTELGFEVPKPSWQEGYENEEENQVQSVSGVYTDDHRESV